MISEVNLIINHDVRQLCVKPYYNHPHGCPNYGKKATCPPHVPLYDEIYDISAPTFVIYNIFDLRAHIDKMRINNPTWNDRQLRICLYWEPKARKQLEEIIQDFRNIYDPCHEYGVERCPEGMGVDLVATMASIGITLKFPPDDIAYQIAVAAIKKY
jgi:predicted metal-binding protein